MRIDLEVESPVVNSTRIKQLGGMFDVPESDRSHLAWHGDLPIEDKDWNVGLIVGPSGSGKTQIARSLWGDLVDRSIGWGASSVIDDFDKSLSMQDIAGICQAVGFSTIPSWKRPYSVLSNGEQFRVGLARRMLETPADEPIVVDEFTSVVDRQVAQIGSHAVQKWIRRQKRRFVAVSCHYDIVDWLQPCWTFEPTTMTFAWRSVQPRPRLNVTISRTPYSTWSIFAPYHYLTPELNRSAKCFALWVDDQLAAFAGVLHRPHSKVRDIKGISRLVTLPDWQGLGLAFALAEAIGAAYRTIDFRLHCYPAHPALMRSFDRSPYWALVTAPGTQRANTRGDRSIGRQSTRQTNAVFAYAGPRMDDEDQAHRLIGS